MNVERKMRSSREARITASIALCILAFNVWSRAFAVSGETPAVDDFTTRAIFAVDSEADPSSDYPERLHPRLSLRSVAGTIEPDSADPKHSIIKLTFYAFSFTPADKAAARRGDIPYLEKRYRAVQSTNVKSADYNGGGWASVQLTIDEHFQFLQVVINVPGYQILLSDRDLKDFVRDCRFDGQKLRLKSKGSHRLDLTSAKVASFTLHWDVDLNTPVVTKPVLKK